MDLSSAELRLREFYQRHGVKLAFAVVAIVMALILWQLFDLGGRVSRAEADLQASTARAERAETDLKSCRADLGKANDETIPGLNSTITGLRGRVGVLEDTEADLKARLATAQKALAAEKSRADRAEKAVRLCDIARRNIVNELAGERK